MVKVERRLQCPERKHVPQTSFWDMFNAAVVQDDDYVSVGIPLELLLHKHMLQMQPHKDA